MGSGLACAVFMDLDTQREKGKNGMEHAGSGKGLDIAAKQFVDNLLNDVGHN